MNTSLTEFLATVVALFAIIDPIGNVGILVSMTESDTAQVRTSQVRRGHIYALILLVIFYLIGGNIMNFFGITIDAVRVAGGLILLKIGFDLLSMREETRSTKAEEVAGRARKDIAFFPLAMPLIAGPGALTLVLTKASDVTHGTFAFMAGDMAAIMVAVFGSFLVLSSTKFLMRVLGVTGMAAISRIMGFILICISVQMVIWGATGVFTKVASGAIHP